MNSLHEVSAYKFVVVIITLLVLKLFSSLSENLTTMTSNKSILGITATTIVLMK